MRCKRSLEFITIIHALYHYMPFRKLDGMKSQIDALRTWIYSNWFGRMSKFNLNFSALFLVSIELDYLVSHVVYFFLWYCHLNKENSFRKIEHRCRCNPIFWIHWELLLPIPKWTVLTRNSIDASIQLNRYHLMAKVIQENWKWKSKPKWISAHVN